MEKNDALVVLSGGQDSSTCLFWAKERFREVYAIAFLYGQKHSLETEYAKYVADKAGVRLEIKDITGMIPQTSNSLTNHDLSMDTCLPETSYPNTFVPGRNLLFISLAAIYAFDKGIRHLVTGVSQTDFSGYPDCRDAFIKSLNETLSLAMDTRFVIHTPLMWMDKAQTWALADSMGVLDLIRHHTLTCYNGIPGDGCGECLSCKLRRKGLEQYLAGRYTRPVIP